ncbi:MAG: DUF3556 domain-containing protein [Aeromicrobium sp.]|uniref:DUF3556 domain-containing protein n=1 Tax=Aeromicrobium sp. TaxID=1871063 RepID=UPI0039E388AF
MGLKDADMPPVDPATFGSLPTLQRQKTLVQHWGEFGFGTPKQIHLMFYVPKIIFYAIVGFALAWFTTPELREIASDAGFKYAFVQPVLYMKIMLFTVFWELLGFGGTMGPLAFKFSPLIGGFLYWGKTGTLRNPPWPDKVPGTAGAHRTVVDAGLYWAATILSGLLVLSGVFGDSFLGLTTLENGQGIIGGSLDNEALTINIVNPYLLLALVVIICLAGLRDSVVWLAARSEQYLPPIMCFALLGYVDMIVALKILIVCVWVWAGVSKIGKHFSLTVAVMLTNTPWAPRSIKKKAWKNYPTDMRPSGFTHFMAHVTGTIAEIVLPLTLLFSTNSTITILAALGMIVFHLFIISTYPIAVPLEWNLFFMLATFWLFIGHPAFTDDAWGGITFGLGDASTPVLIAAVVAGCLFPIWGEFIPKHISFLVAMRQYAGNWASGLWAFRNREMEERLDQNIKKASKMQINQVAALYGEEVAEIFIQKGVSFRMMHYMGRGLMSLHMRHTPSIDDYVIREAEFVCNALTGWNFGDGHLHDDRLIAAVQELCQYEPGDLVVAFHESNPIHKDYVEYRVIDAALGVVERGTFKVADCVEEQPWLPNGPVDHVVTWTKPGYTAPSDGSQYVGWESKLNG